MMRRCFVCGKEEEDNIDLPETVKFSCKQCRASGREDFQQFY